MRDLSPTLRKEILLHMNRECVLNCDFFRDVSNECILGLVHNFKFAVYLEHDIIAEEGEMAEDLVFLIHGTAKVTKLGRIMPVSLLRPGDYFGEKSLLMHHRNATSVIATENCDTRILNAVDFEDLTLDFPELEESIRKKSDHMDVTEYDAHTRRNKILQRAQSKRRKSRILDVGDLTFNAEYIQEKRQIEESAFSPESPQVDVSGSFEWPGSPKMPEGMSQNQVQGKPTFVPASAQVPGTGGPNISRPMTAGSKARISEMASSVTKINGRVEIHTKQLKRLESYLVSVDNKLDMILRNLNGNTPVETTGVGTPAPSSSGFSL